jgi:hypothetical protein
VRWPSARCRAPAAARAQPCSHGCAAASAARLPPLVHSPSPSPRPPRTPGLLGSPQPSECSSNYRRQGFHAANTPADEVANMIKAQALNKGAWHRLPVDHSGWRRVVHIIRLFGPPPFSLTRTSKDVFRFRLMFTAKKECFHALYMQKSQLVAGIHSMAPQKQDA